MRAQPTSAPDHPPYDRKARRKPANLSVNSDLLGQAKELGINLSATLEEALASEVRQRQRQAWLDENRDSITAYNEHVAEHGVFGKGLRSF